MNRSCKNVVKWSLNILSVPPFGILVLIITRGLVNNHQEELSKDLNPYALDFFDSTNNLKFLFVY